jgi:sporulation protein YlmC with PRC-barrel domain
MMQTKQFTIGAEACGSDGVCGTVSRVVIDPVADAVTHLVVEPKHRHSNGRLVPIDLADATSGEVRLRCTRAEFDQLDPAEETHFLPEDDGYASYSREQAFVWPYYGLGMGGLGTGMWAGGSDVGMGTGADIEHVAEPVTTDTVPVGEVAVRRGDEVHATDGTIGRVQGLIVVPSSHHVTHVLLQEGHLFGRKEVAIPISAMTRDADGIHLNISKEQIENLPPVALDQPNA